MHSRNAVGACYIIIERPVESYLEDYRITVQNLLYVLHCSFFQSNIKGKAVCQIVA